MIPKPILYLLASIAFIYIIASIYYMIYTQVKNIGTPFSDALQAYPELLEIKKQSSDIRGRIFGVGVGVGLFLLLTFFTIKFLINKQ
jgi:hypothetical protein